MGSNILLWLIAYTKSSFSHFLNYCVENIGENDLLIQNDTLENISKDE